MFKSGKTNLILIILPLLILSCWNSSPTSDKSKTFIVTGSVINKTGFGIQGVSVQISGANFSCTETKDSTGTFTFNNVKSGDYKIKAFKDSCYFKPANMEFTVEKTDIDILKFTSADNYIHGRVLDILNGKGIKSVRIALFKKLEKGSKYNSSTVTDGNGEFGFYDLEKSAYVYWYQPKYFISGETNFSFEAAAFDNQEIILRDYYLSSENLPITKAEFLKDSNTLNIEWKPSESQYISGYFVRLFKNPDDANRTEIEIFTRTGAYYVQSDNKDSRKITYQMVMRMFDENVISGEVFMGVSPIYKVGNISYYGPCSDTIKIRLYW